MPNNISILSTLLILQKKATIYADALKTSVAIYATSLSEPVGKLDVNQHLESVISKYRSHIESDNKTPPELTPDEWQAIHLAYTTSYNHLENLVKNMRLHGISSEIINNVQSDINKNYEEVNAVKMFFMGI